MGNEMYRMKPGAYCKMQNANCKMGWRNAGKRQFDICNLQFEIPHT
jgi:hypothetical protein